MAKDDDILAAARKLFDRVSKDEGTQRSEELDDIRFCGLLDQWPAQMRALREADKTGARPCLTVDKTNQYKNQVVNQMRQNRAGIKARPVDDLGDEEVAEVFQGIIRQIEDASKATIAYDWAGDGSVTSGLGYFRILTEYDGDSFNQEIRIRAIKNRFSVYPGKYEQPDGSDMKECLVTELVSKTEFQREYPDADVSSFQTAATGDSMVGWWTDDEVRVAEYFCIKPDKQDLLLLSDGNSVWLDKYTPDPMGLVTEVKRRKASRNTVHWYKVTGAEVLEHTTIPGLYIPIIPVHGIETIVEGKRYLRGLIRGMKDPQRMYNWARSTVAEGFGLTVKAPYIGYVGQFKTKSAQWAASNRTNYAYLEVDPLTVEGTLAPLPQRQPFAGVPAGLMADMQLSEHDIQASAGMYDSNIAKDGNAKSGRALIAQRQQGDLATLHFPDNLSISICHAGRIIIGMIPFVYDTAQVVRMLGEDGTVQHVSIDPEQAEAVTEQRDENGAIKKIFNLGVGKYDVTVTTGQSYATRRMEGAEFFTQWIQAHPESAPIIGDLAMKAQDFPGADIAADRFKKMMPPQLQDENQNETPEVQQVKAQASQAIQQLQDQLEAAHAAMKEADQEARQLADKALTAEARAANDARKLEIEAYDAQTKRLQVELAAASAEVTPERLTMIEDAVVKLIDQMQPPMDGASPEPPPMAPTPDQPPTGGFFTPAETQAPL